MTYKYQKEHNRVKGNGHGFGQKSIGTKIEQGDVMRSRTEQGSGFGTGFRAGDMKQNEHRKHEMRGGMGLGMGDEQISRNDKAGGTD